MNIVEEGTFQLRPFASELADAAANHAVGTTLLFENDRVRVWEVRLEPGVRAPFHAHVHPYFWTCVVGGIGRQRSPDGSFATRRYEEGDTRFSAHSANEPMLHDLENVGGTALRFLTVELLR